MLSMMLLLVGFFPLVFGAALLVDGASAFAKRLNIPSIVIGLTIVALGTSSPELVVNLFASYKQSSDIVLGNIIGSNIFNILVVLGVSAMVTPLILKRNTAWVEIPFTLLSAVVVFVLANDVLIDRAGHSLLSRSDGFVLLLFFLVFLGYNVYIAMRGEFESELEITQRSFLVSLLLMALGLFLLTLGGWLIVQHAIDVARFFDVPERIIALTIVSIGTSLPELATSAVAAWKKSVDIALGNILGSNVFNSFFILGTSATLYPVSLQSASNFDILANILFTILLFGLILKGRKLSFFNGIALVFSYAVYLGLIFVVK
jgi:cation:H+ antiporter